MKRVALNGRFTGVPQPTGTQTVAFHLFDKIIRANRDLELVVFGDSRFMQTAEWKKLPGVLWIETPFQDHSRNAAQLWEQFILPLQLKRYCCALAHHPITTSPAFAPGCRSLVTLHDLNFLRHPEWYSRSFRWAYKGCAMPGLRRATKVVTISNYVREQTLEHLGFAPEKVGMIYNGVKPIVTPRTASEEGGRRYLFCVGSLPPHKNLVRTIRAFLSIREEFPGLELHLAGRPHPRLGKEEAELGPLLRAEGVKVLGYLSEEDLAAAYAGAALYCYPSLEEGFGLPVLEAMSAGTPVLTSNVSCLPEIAGKAAFLVDPYSVEAIAEGMRKALRMTPSERECREQEGRDWAGQFTWERAAAQYLALYGELV